MNILHIYNIIVFTLIFINFSKAQKNFENFPVPFNSLYSYEINNNNNLKLSNI